MKLPLIKRDVEIQGGIDQTTSKVFSNNIGVGWHSSIANGNCVQGLERVNQSKRFAILLEHTEPLGVVG